MNPNNHRQNSAGQFASVLRWVIIAAFFTIAGLSYLYLKNQMYVGGLQKRALEHELSDLILQNNVMEKQVDQLKSRTALQQRLNEGFIKLVPISAPAVVHIRSADTNRWSSTDRSTSEYRPVSHETTTGHR